MSAFPRAHFKSPVSGMLRKVILDAFASEGWQSSLTVEEHLSFGSVYLNGSRILGDAPVKEGDLIKIHLIPKHYPFDRVSFEPQVVYECTDFLVVDKPAIFPTHATSDNWRENLHYYLQVKRGEKLYVTSRLDAETEGLLLYARTREGLAGLNELFRRKLVKKSYRALTKERPPQGLWTHYQTDRIGLRKEFLLEARSLKDRICQLSIESVEEIPHGYISSIRLITGRTHQIRGQFALAGLPLIGDRLYGDAEDQRPLGLECSQLALTWNEKKVPVTRFDMHRIYEMTLKAHIMKK